MKRYILMTAMVIISAASAMAQYSRNLEGVLNGEVKWTFDGKTLTLTNNLVNTSNPHRVNIPDFDPSNLSPWSIKKLAVRNVRIGKGIEKIGSCAFYNCRSLTDVTFDGTSLKEIGWGAFMNCSKLRTFSLPTQLKKIETIAFANCLSLTSVKIPDQCAVEDQAFVNCPEIKSIDVSPTASLGHYVFANETKMDGKVRHTLYDGEIKRLPAYINLGNCHTFGLAKSTVMKYFGDGPVLAVDYDYKTSEVDSVIPEATMTNNNTYALIIGNQNYRFAANVPYAIHDARVFRDYCVKALGIPSENVYELEDATKAMINEDGFQWLDNISNRQEKKFILYYAGHGVPDTKDANKAYLLPADIRGAKPQNGIALDDFYAKLGDLNFDQTVVFLDACFSGVNRNNNGVVDGLRDTEIEAEKTTLGGGNVIVFAAAQGNETAQGYDEQGHGLFTYFLLKNLQTYGSRSTFGMMADDINSSVSKTAPTLKLQKQQTPSAQSTKNLEEMWRQMTF